MPNIINRLIHKHCEYSQTQREHISFDPTYWTGLWRSYREVTIMVNLQYTEVTIIVNLQCNLKSTQKTSINFHPKRQNSAEEVIPIGWYTRLHSLIKLWPVFGLCRTTWCDTLSLSLQCLLTHFCQTLLQTNQVYCRQAGGRVGVPDWSV